MSLVRVLGRDFPAICTDVLVFGAAVLIIGADILVFCTGLHSYLMKCMPIKEELTSPKNSLFRVTRLC